MQKSFWIQKWQDNEIGFHKSQVNPLLKKYIDRLGLQKGDRIFVPLCGKSLDMLYLRDQGYHVIGIDLSDMAIQQFFAENDISFEVNVVDTLKVYHSDHITLYQGDVFELKASQLEGVKGIYDRASLIALPNGMEQRYVEHLYHLLPPIWSWLLVTLDFADNDRTVGPPFSTNSNRVERLFEEFASMQLLHEEDIIESEPRFQSKGLNCLWERVHILSPMTKN